MVLLVSKHPAMRHKCGTMPVMYMGCLQGDISRMQQNTTSTILNKCTAKAYMMISATCIKALNLVACNYYGCCTTTPSVGDHFWQSYVYMLQQSESVATSLKLACLDTTKHAPAVSIHQDNELDI